MYLVLDSIFSVVELVDNQLIMHPVIGELKLWMMMHFTVTYR